MCDYLTCTARILLGSMPIPRWTKITSQRDGEFVASIFPKAASNNRLRMPPVESKLTYTKGRDIYSVGVVLLQMLLGRNIMEKYPDPQTALHMSRLPVLLTRLYS